MMSSIEVAWKPSPEKHLQALVRICWRRWARVVSLSRGIAHSLNKNDRLRYSFQAGTFITKQEQPFLFEGPERLIQPDPAIPTDRLGDFSWPRPRRTQTKPRPPSGGTPRPNMTR